MSVILFAGSEREALVQAPSGAYDENASGLSGSDARIGSMVFGGQYYDCVLTQDATDVGITFYTWVDRFGMNNHDMLQIMDASNNMLAAIRTDSGQLYGRYWNGSAYVNMTPTATEPNGTAQQMVMRCKKGAAGTGFIEFYIDGVLLSTTGAITLTSFGDISHFRLFYSGDRQRNFWEVICVEAVTPTFWSLKTIVPTTNGDYVDGTGTLADINEAHMDLGTAILLEAGDVRSWKSPDRGLDRRVQSIYLVARIARSSTGPTKVKPFLIVPGDPTLYYGTTFDLTLSADSYKYSWELNPSTSLAWTVAEANDPDLQFGWEPVP